MAALGGNLRADDWTPPSGQYPVIGLRGGDTGREVTSVEGRPSPPTSRPGETYGKPDITKHPKPLASRFRVG